MIVTEIAALALVVLGLAGPAAASAATPLTQVSFTFDDSNDDQLQAATILKNAGMHATYYTVSGFVGLPGSLTLSDLRGLAADGNEIGGHSVNHPDLTTLTTDEATRQVCNDRVNLANWGFTVTSFAYPFAAANATTGAVVKGCGYNSARGLGDIRSRFGCGSCPFAESTPPADPYYTKALDEVDTTWTLADLQTAVTNAEANGGGWVQFTFHHICAGSGCDELSVSPTIFSQFVAWLAPRATTNNTMVRTVGQVVGGSVQPVHPGPTTPAPGPGVNGVRNPSLETAGTGGIPKCWMAGGYGTNTPTFRTTTSAAKAHSGTRAERLTVSGYASGDAKLLPTLDLGDCSPTVTPGHTYSLRGWYKSTAVTQFAVYYRTSLGAWVYWTSSPWFAAATTWTQATWTTPAIPAEATGLSFGLNLFNNGTLNTDDYGLYDSVGAPAAQAVAVVAAPSALAAAATPSVTRQSSVYVPAATAVPVGPAAHRARADRHGPTPRLIAFVPGPGSVQPGAPLPIGHGGLTG